MFESSGDLALSDSTTFHIRLNSGYSTNGSANKSIS
jgi:hypothetical protein